MSNTELARWKRFKTYTCETCSVEFQSSKGANAPKECFGCVNDVELKYVKLMEAKAAEWAAKHKCRQCNQGLPLTRYFKCEECDKPSLRETADEFDECDDMGDGLYSYTPEVKHAERRASMVDRRKVARSKACKKCLEVKTPDLFYKHHSTFDGISSACKACIGARAKKNSERIKAAQDAKRAQMAASS